MKCPSCGYELPENARFCSSCGTKIEQSAERQENKSESFKQDEMTDYWIKNIKSDEGVEFTIGDVKLSYDAKLVTYNNFIKLFSRYCYDQQSRALDFCKEKILKLEDLLSYGVDYAKQVEENGYKDAVNKLCEIGIDINYDSLIKYPVEHEFDSKTVIEKLYKTLKEKNADSLSTARWFAQRIEACAAQGLERACEVVYEKKWLERYTIDRDEMERVYNIAKNNQRDKKICSEAGFEMLKLNPYAKTAYLTLFTARPSLTDELINIATYFGKEISIQEMVEANVKSNPDCFFVSDREDSVLAINRLMLYADESALVAFKLEQYFCESLKNKIENNTLKEEDIAFLDQYNNSGNKFAQFLKPYLMFRSMDEKYNKSAKEKYAMEICKLAEEKVPSAMAMRGFWGIRGYYNAPTSDALLYLKDAADLMHPTAMYWLGDCYFYGKHGAPIDKEKGTVLVNRAAYAGQKAAINALNGNSNEGCYITTAVCEFQGKPDNCYELTMFRKFRDEWLVTQEGGKELVKEYYETAPQIVKNIDEREDRNRIYSHIWGNWLKPCLSDIENGNYDACKQTYIQMVENLRRKYL